MHSVYLLQLLSGLPLCLLSCRFHQSREGVLSNTVHWLSRLMGYLAKIQTLLCFHFFTRFGGRMRCDNEDADQQPKSSYWTEQLFNYEANDSERFVCRIFFTLSFWQNTKSFFTFTTMVITQVQEISVSTPRKGLTGNSSREGVSKAWGRTCEQKILYGMGLTLPPMRSWLIIAAIPN